MKTPLLFLVSMASGPPAYTPGVCNIGPPEIRRRRQGGIAGAAAAAALLAALLAAGAPRPWRLVVFLPAFIAAVGFLQAGLRFCAAYGLRGVYNVLKPAGQTETVGQRTFRRLDRRKALQIAALSALIGLAAALAAWLVP